MPCGESAGASTGIGGVDSSVGEAVEGHGRGASGEHGDDDPEKLMSAGKAGGGGHGSAERERESEDGMLPLDHFKRDAQVVENGHRKIVRHFVVRVAHALSETSFIPCRMPLPFSEMLLRSPISAGAML